MNYEKYLVTGAKDPVGRLVVQMLLAEGCQVRVLVPPESDYSLLKGMGAEVAEGDILDKDSLKDFLAVDNPRHSAVIHTEEILSISNNKNMDMRRTNVAGAQNVIDMSMRAKIGRFVYLGSAYSLDPDSALSGSSIKFDRTKVDGDYAATKAEASAYLMEKIQFNKFNASLLLPTFIIGPGFSEDYDMNKILKKYLENKISTVSGGHAFVDVRNVATALVAVCENGESGGAYILNGEYKSSQEFFDEVSKTTGSEKVKEMPKWTQSKSMDKVVDTFYRITKKDNPKEVYALFMNNPDANYESTVDGILPDSEVRKVHDTLVDVLTRPGNEVRPDRIDLEKSAAAAEAIKASKPDTEEVKEVSTVSEAVIKRAVESAAKAEESGEEAKKRAEAAAAARARVQAKIEAAKMKAEQQAEAARAENRERQKVAVPANDIKPAEPKPTEETKPDSLMAKLSVADILAEAEAKKKAEKEAVMKVEEIPQESPVIETPEVEKPAPVEVAQEVEALTVEPEPVSSPVVKIEEEIKEEIPDESEIKAEEDFSEFVDEAVLKTASAEPVPVIEPSEPEPKAEVKEEVKEDNSNKPLWERLPAADISEDEFFGDDSF